MSTVIDSLRHGTPVGGNRYRGNSIDDALSEKGWQQMWDAVSSQETWDVIVTSPLQRCSAFARAYADKYNLDVHVDDRLKEVGFGSWEGKSSQQVYDADNNVMRNFYRDPVAHKPEGAEDLSHFQQRVSDALDDMLQMHKNRNILTVAHAGVIRAAITATIGAPLSSMYRISIGNASLIRIRDDHIRPATVLL